MRFAVIAVTALIAGLVQGVTGFGAGIVLMMALPYFLPVPQSAGVSTGICIVLFVSMIIRYRRAINLKKALLPSVLNIAICTVTISFATGVDQHLAKKILGGFLLLLAVYYLFLSPSGGAKPIPLPARLACIIISAVCDGLFGIGGPLMVVYFLSRTDSKEEYLGTIQAFFLINAVYNTAFRIIRGIILPEHLLLIVIGAAGIVLGALIAGRVVDRLNESILRKLVYGMIGVSGILNLVL